MKNKFLYLTVLIVAMTLDFSRSSQSVASTENFNNCQKNLLSNNSKQIKLTKTISEDNGYFSSILPEGTQGPWYIRYRVTFPKNFDSTKRYGVVYFLHGRTGDRFVLDSLGIQQAFDNYIGKGGNSFIIVTLDGGNNYWMNAALKNEKWGDVVTQEIIAQIEKNNFIINNQSGRILAGISMGGHGAIQNALNHPGIYAAVAAHSPVFRTQEEASKDFAQQFGTGDDFQNRDPFSLILFKGKSLNIPIWIDTGGKDFALNNTRNFANLVKQRNYKADLHIGEDIIGSHVNAYWQYHLPEYLDWYGKHLPVPQSNF